MRSSFLLTVRLHRLNFYVALGKLIAELQGFSQCNQETPMMRFYSSIYSDEMLITQMSRKSLPHNKRRSKCSAAFPDHAQPSLIRVENSRSTHFHIIEWTVHRTLLLVEY
jgi:hypothetical protein